MSEHISPEEKLLRLIRSTKAKAAESAGTAPAVRRRPGALTTAAVRERAAALRGAFRGTCHGMFRKRKLVYAALILCASALAWSFAAPLFFDRRIAALQPAVPQAMSSPANGGGALERPLEFYTGPLADREIFGRIAAAETDGGPQIAQIKASDRVASFTLIGIVSSEPPQAIIEDKKTQKTYYVSRGQSIGDMKIEEIKDGKIVVTCSGERFELYM